MNSTLAEKNSLFLLTPSSKFWNVAFQVASMEQGKETIQSLKSGSFSSPFMNNAIGGLKVMYMCVHAFFIPEIN